jgi:hypothetical protein
MSVGVWFTRKHKQMKPFFFAMSGWIAVNAFAQAVPALYQGADLPLGEKLIAENQCDACHIRNVGGNGDAIYRPAGRVNSLGALRGQVEACNTMLNLGLFPEEVTSISAVLNRDHYRFK